MMKIYDYIGKIEVFIAKSALAILSALVFLSAVARTVRYPIVWAVDAATFLFAWCVFLSGDIAVRKDKLVSIDIITKMLPGKLQFHLKVINQLIIILFLAALIWFGFWLSYTTRMRTFQGIPNFSYTWVTLSVPVGSVLMMISTILKMKDQIVNRYRERTNAKGKGVL